MTDTSANNPRDSLGLEHLGHVIEEVRPDKRGLAEITDAYRAVMANYRALQDRYQLLKASNRLLAEEVAWLRDQCDDFAVERNELVEKLAKKRRDPGSSRPKRRLEDRR